MSFKISSIQSRDRLSVLTVKKRIRFTPKPLQGRELMHHLILTGRLKWVKPKAYNPIVDAVSTFCNNIFRKLFKWDRNEY